MIELIYQTLFNYFAKRSGYDSTLPILASSVTLLLASMLVVDIMFLINILFANPLLFSINKGIAVLCIIATLVLNYYFLFNVLKIKKNAGTTDWLFKLNEKVYLRTLKGIGIHISIFVFLMFTFIFFSPRGS